MRFTILFLAFVLAASASRAQIISVDEYSTRLDIGVVETELLLYERKEMIFALFTARGPFEERVSELNVSRDGCHEVFFTGHRQNEPFTVSLNACSDKPHCAFERQVLTVTAVYTLISIGDGRRPVIKAAPIVKTIRPGLRALPC